MVHPGEPVTIKLYGNGRLYEPAAARYVTLSEIQARTCDSTVTVCDAITGADVTHLVLLQRRTEH